MTDIKGLTDSEVQESREKYGSNSLTELPGETSVIGNKKVEELSML